MFNIHRFLDTINPKNVYREIKYFIQRGMRGYSDRDVWDFDYYLAQVIQGGICKLYKNGTGLPGNMTEDEWQKVLIDIAYGFYFYRQVEDNPKIGKKRYNQTKRKECLNKAFDLLKKHFESLWD